MNQDIRRKLDRITDILWAGGVTNPVTYIEQLSYLIYLKLLDEEESNRELQARLKGDKGNTQLLFPRQAERYRWSAWRFRSGIELRDFVRDEVFPYMASLHCRPTEKVLVKRSHSGIFSSRPCMEATCRGR
jgi:type I restriction enzyme M protein